MGGVGTARAAIAMAGSCSLFHIRLGILHFQVSQTSSESVAVSWTLVGACIYNVFVAASSSTIPCGPPAAKHALAVDSWWCALLDARQLAARIVRLECVATRRAHGIVRATGEWLHYTLTMFSAVGRLNYLSGASRRRAVCSAVSSGLAASLPLFDAVLGGLHGGASSPWLLAQNKSM